MTVIMNPPYDKNLHLKVLNETIKHSDNVVSLQPVRWLQDPLAEYKKHSDYEKFQAVRSRIKELNVIDAVQAQQWFGTGQYENLAVYKMTKEGGADVKPKPFVCQGLFDKVNLPTYLGKYKSFYDFLSPEGKPDYSTPFVKISSMHGSTTNPDDWCRVCTNDKSLALTTKISSGKAGTCMRTANFKTGQERDNFFDYCHTKFVRACNKNIKTNIRWPGYAIPVMEDYTKQWTDNELYTYFELTPEEIKIIEESIK